VRKGFSPGHGAAYADAGPWRKGNPHGPDKKAALSATAPAARLPYR
jgi:hypothetical protein